MRIVVLTESAGHAARALLQLSLRGIDAAAVLLASRPTVSFAAESAAAIRGRSPRRLAAGALRRLASLLDPRARFATAGPLEGLAERVVTTEPLNSHGMIRVLESAEPDVLMLTATALVNVEVLAIPRIATLNSHPGLLPWVRGNGAVEHAIRQRIPVGVSVHHVDAGADTGDVVFRRLVRVTAADTLTSIRQKADELRWVALADVVRQFVSGVTPPRASQARRFPSAHWPTSAERAEAEHLVTTKESYRRYCAWRELAGGDVLPEGDAWFDPTTLI